MVIEIREVSQQDKAQWLQLWEGYTRFYGSPQPSDVTEYTRQRMLDSASPMLGRVALADGNIAGFAICVLHEGTGKDACLLSGRSVCCPADARKRHAVALMQALQAEGKRKGGRGCTGTLVLIIRPGVCMMNLRPPMTMFVTA